MLLRAFFPQIHPHFKFAHVFNCPHVEGRITIRPYACVFWTFANIDVNTCKYTCKYTKKASWAWCEYVCVCRRGDLQIAHITIRLCYNSLTFQIRPYFQLPPCGRANCSHTPLRQLADFAPTCVFSGRSQIYM